MGSNASQIREAGTPDPLRFPPAHPVANPGEPFGAGFALSATLPTTILVAIAGAFVIRLRGIFTTTEAAPPAPMGVLTFEYRRPAPFEDTSYAPTLDLPHAPENISKDAEFLCDITPTGEPYLAVTFTPDGGVDPTKAISVTFLDVLQQ